MIEVKRSFQPITITIRDEKDARLLEEALELLLEHTNKKQGSWWAGYKNDKELTPAQYENRISIKKILVALNPHRWIERPMFLSEHQ